MRAIYVTNAEDIGVYEKIYGLRLLAICDLTYFTIF
jgi:hypothetical protein